MTCNKQWGVTLMALLLLGLSAGVNAEKSLTALIPWEGNGEVHQVGPDTMLFLGSFEGIIYVQTSEGELDEGFVVCPGSQTINVKTRKTSGDGHCMITPSAGDVVYAEWSCAGEVGGCKGSFKLTGGSGKFKGVTGSSELLVRSALNVLVAGMSSGSVVRSATGIAMLPDLKYNMPNKK